MERAAPQGQALGRNYRLVQGGALLLAVVAAISVFVLGRSVHQTRAEAEACVEWIAALAGSGGDPAAVADEILRSEGASEGLRALATDGAGADALLDALTVERRAHTARLARLWMLAEWTMLLATMMAIALVILSVLGRRLVEQQRRTLVSVARLREARQAAEAIAAEKSDLLRAMVASAPFGIHVFTPAGKPVLSSSSLARRHDVEMPDMRRLSLDDIRRFPLAQAAGIAAVFDRAAEGETFDLPAVDLLISHTDPTRGDGRVCVAPLVFPVTNDAGAITHVGVLMRDASEQQGLIGRLQRAERLAAIGTLAAGVAHELNNPLTSLSMNHELMGELIEDGLEALTDQRELLADMARSLHHIQSVTHDLAEIARPDGSRANWAELSMVIEAAARAVAPAELGRVALLLELDELPPVVGGSARLEQVFQNLLKNAIYATADQGSRITVRARREGADAVVVEVEDDGCGMSESVRARMFEPFFTTHPGRDGTGLGMYLVQVFLEELGGSVSVRTAPGEGTTVSVRLRPAPELTLPPSLDGLGSPSQGVHVVVVSQEALDVELRGLIPEAAELRRVRTAPALLQALHQERQVDLIIWDAATMGTLQTRGWPGWAPGKVVELDGDTGELQRPLDRGALLAVVERVLFGGLGLGRI